MYWLVGNVKESAHFSQKSGNVSSGVVVWRCFFNPGPFKPALKLHWASLSRLFISYDDFKIIFGLSLFLITKLVLFFVCFLVFYLFSRLMLSLAKGCLFIYLSISLRFLSGLFKWQAVHIYAPTLAKSCSYWRIVLERERFYKIKLHTSTSLYSNNNNFLLLSFVIRRVVHKKSLILFESSFNLWRIVCSRTFKLIAHSSNIRKALLLIMLQQMRFHNRFCQRTFRRTE